MRFLTLEPRSPDGTPLRTLTAPARSTPGLWRQKAGAPPQKIGKSSMATDIAATLLTRMKAGRAAFKVTVSYTRGPTTLTGISASKGRTPFEVMDGGIMVASESADYLILATDLGALGKPESGDVITDNGRSYMVTMPAPLYVYETIGPYGAVLKIHTKAGARTDMPPSITSALALTANTLNPFSYQIQATNSPVSFSASGLPDGLSIDTSTGVISGTLTTAGQSTFTISATNAHGTDTRTVTITIQAAWAFGAGQVGAYVEQP